MATKKVAHPYHPVDLDIPHYVPNDKSLVEILGVFFGLIAVVIIGIWIYMGTLSHLRNKYLTRLKICWFLVCGLIHFILEGYFAVYHEKLAGMQTYLAQTWKEYSMGDSRYMTSDSFTVNMETITAFIDGPLAFLATYAFLSNKPYRFVVQMILSLCQLYGDTLYMTIEYRDGFKHSEYGHPLYFWFYFFFMNILWIIIPFICIVEAYRKLTQAQGSHDDQHKASNSNKRK